MTEKPEKEAAAESQLLLIAREVDAGGSPTAGALRPDTVTSRAFNRAACNVLP